MQAARIYLLSRDMDMELRGSSIPYMHSVVVILLALANGTFSKTSDAA